MTTNETLTAKYEFVDLKYRDGMWWGRGVKTSRARNSSVPSDVVEVTKPTVEECIEALL